MKRNILIIACTIFIATNSFSQDFIKELEKIKKVTIHEIYGNINIEGVTIAEIQISKKSQKRIPKDVKMIKPRYFKDDNTNLGLSFEYIDEIIIISPANKEAQFTNYNFKIPKSAQLEIKTEHLDEEIKITDTKNMEIFSNINIQNIETEINIDVFASDITLSGITGPLALAIFIGNFHIDFSELNQVNPSVIEMFAGNVDVILPKQSSLHPILGTKFGEIYSEFKIDITETKPLLSKEEKFFWGNPEKKLESKFLQDKTPNVGEKYNYSKVIGKVNEGGVSLSINILAGNINLKKK